MDLELRTTEGNEVEVAADRGISLQESVGGALTRFLPGSLVVIVPFMLEPFLNPGALGSLAWAAATASSLTAGFVLGLEALRRWLYPDAAVDGRRSLIAGVLAPLTLGIVAFVLGVTSVLGAASLGVAVGMGVALLMFFAWLTPTANPDDPFDLDAPARSAGDDDAQEIN